MKKTVCTLLTLCLLLSLTACGGNGNTVENQKPTASSQGEPEQNISAPERTEEPSEEQEGEDGAMSSNILVAYFSLAGEQYNVGVIEEGNTSIIARMIAEQTGADLFEIEAVTPYPESHSELLDISRQEMSEDARRPAIAHTVENMDDYDTVFIGYPNWWGDMPMIVYNFVESYDFSGKTIVPFCTHGGSGLSGTEGTIADITGATTADGFAISGETAQSDRETSLARVTEWLGEAGYVQ